MNLGGGGGGGGRAEEGSGGGRWAGQRNAGARADGRADRRRAGRRSREVAVVAPIHSFSPGGSKISFVIGVRSYLQAYNRCK